MRRDYFTLEMHDVGGGAADRPSIAVTADGPTDGVEQRLLEDGALEVDVAVRHQPDGDDETGVLSVTDRMTGEFILEVNVSAARIRALIDAAQAYATATNDADGCYGITIRTGDRTLFETEKRTLLVYDEEGSLLRQHSLIPSGVEL